MQQDNKQQPQQSAQQPAQSQSKSSPIAALLAKLKSLLPKRSSKKQQTQQPAVQPAQVPPAQEAQPKGIKQYVPFMVKMLMVIFVVIGALYFINLFYPRAVQILRNNNPLATPTPEPTPTATPISNFPPSKYASDPEVLQIDSEIERLEQGLNSIQFTDDTLHPPLLDWDITFAQ
jgi:hypothetical protein